MEGDHNMGKRGTCVSESKEKLVNSFVEIICDEVLKWFKEEAHTNIPLVLTSLRDGLTKIFSTYLDNDSELKLPVESMDSYLEGRKGGEISKELAMAAGMAKIGLSKEQIDQVVEYSRHAWEPIEKRESP